MSPPGLPPTERFGGRLVAVVPAGAYLWQRWDLKQAGVPVDLTPPVAVADPSDCEP